MPSNHCCLPNRLWIFTIFFVVLSYFTQLILLAKTHNVNSPKSDWAWVGCLQSTSATFRVRVAGDDGSTRRLEVFQESGEHLFFDLPNANDGGDTAVHALTVPNLTPDTQYAYRVVGDDNAQQIIYWQGSFRTPGKEGSRFSFSIAAGGCSMTGSQHGVYRDILEHSPLLMIHMGDLHYEDLRTTSLHKRREAFDLVLGSQSQAELFAHTPIAYTWDDHDYVGDNSDGSDVEAGNAARKSYHELVPHCPLPAAEEENPAAPYHAFTIGTVRFIISDLRSESTKGGSIYSSEQQAWLYQELANHANYDFVVWVTSRPWMGTSDDTWSGFPTDRRNLSQHLADINITNLLVLSADNHQVAFDDGTHTSFATESEGAHFPLLHAGPLSNLGSNPYDTSVFGEGCSAYFGEINHQYAIVDFDFEEGVDDHPCVNLKAYRSTESPNELIFEKRLCLPLVQDTPPSDPDQTCSTGTFSAKGKGVYWTYFGLSLILFGLVFWKSSHWKQAGCISLWHVVSSLLTCVAAGLGMLSWGLQAADPVAVGGILIVQTALACALVVSWLVTRRKGQSDDAEEG